MSDYHVRYCAKLYRKIATNDETNEAQNSERITIDEQMYSVQCTSYTYLFEIGSHSHLLFGGFSR